MPSILNATTVNGIAVSGDNSGVLALQTNNGTTAVTIDTSQNVGIGTTSPTSFGGGYKTLEVKGSTSGNGGVFRAATSDNSYIFDMYVSTAGGSLETRGAYPIAFRPNGVEAMRIPAAGGLQVVNSISVGNATPTTSGAGITFPATQSASSDANTLDDYEEGTWTPTITFNGGSAGQTYSVRAGSYTKVGRMVYATCRVSFTNKGSSTGSANISGLPFTALAGNGGYATGTFAYFANEANGSRWSVTQLPVVDSGSSYIFLRYYNGSGTFDHNEASFNNNTDIIIAVTYQV